MRSLFASALTVLVGGLGVSGLAAGCGDSSGEGGGGGVGGGEGLANPGRICIDNASIMIVNEPDIGENPNPDTKKEAGLQVRFRVLDGNGDPVRPLETSVENSDITIINDESGVAFGSGDEGDAISSTGEPSELQLYSVLVLDLSHSIYEAGLEDDVLAGADAYITEAFTNTPGDAEHRVAIFAIGAPDTEKQISPQFRTFEDGLIGGDLMRLRTEGDRGTTDLYTSYILGLRFLEENTPEDNPNLVVERFLVMISDGSHEAGNGEALRELALSEKSLSPSTKITIGLAGNLSPCALEELAGRPESDCQNPLAGCREGLSCNPETAAPPSCTQYIPDVEGADIADVFQTVASRAAGIADSNYQVAVCTPVAMGNSTVTLVVDVDGAQDSETLFYDADQLSGRVQECDPEEINEFVPEVVEGGGGAGGGDGGGGGDAGGGGAGTGGAGGGGGA